MQIKSLLFNKLPLPAPQVREAEEQCQARRGYAEGLCSRETARSDLG